jgi:hypothetical protein
MKITPGSIVADEGEHVVLTGPITGAVTLEDGTVVDVSAPAVVAADEVQAAEIAHAIGQYWADPDTPSHPEHVTEDGVVPFEYDDSAYRATIKRANKKG